MPTPKTAPTTNETPARKAPAEQKPVGKHKTPVQDSTQGLPETVGSERDQRDSKVGTARDQPSNSPKTKDAEPVRKPIEFNATQIKIADAVSDLLVSGGTDQNLNALIDLAIDHTVRRELSYFTNLYRRQKRDMEQKIQENIAQRNLATEWRLDIDIAIRNNKRAPEPLRQQPADVSGMIRETLRDELKYFINAFMLRGSLTELYFLRETFVNWDSAGCQKDEVSIAHGFHVALGLASSFMKVPEALLGDMQQYLDALRKVKAEGRED